MVIDAANEVADKGLKVILAPAEGTEELDEVTAMVKLERLLT